MLAFTKGTLRCGLWNWLLLYKIVTSSYTKQIFDSNFRTTWRSTRATSPTSATCARSSSTTRRTCGGTCVCTRGRNPTRATPVVRASFARTTCWSTARRTLGSRTSPKCLPSAELVRRSLARRSRLRICKIYRGTAKDTPTTVLIGYAKIYLKTLLYIITYCILELRLAPNYNGRVSIFSSNSMI